MSVFDLGGSHEFAKPPAILKREAEDTLGRFGIREVTLESDHMAEGRRAVQAVTSEASIVRIDEHGVPSLQRDGIMYDGRFPCPELESVAPVVGALCQLVEAVPTDSELIFIR
jgi:hypothetical protein